MFKKNPFLGGGLGGEQTLNKIDRDRESLETQSNFGGKKKKISVSVL